MEIEDFIQTFPRLYHMAYQAALPSILRHGLLSTSALMDLFEIEGPERDRIELTTRRESIRIFHPVHGVALIRDQKPIMNDQRLEQSLGGSTTPAEFHRLLNSMVFFWVVSDRLDGLRNAQAYRGEPQLVLTLDTRRLVDAYGEQMMLCPMNSGACRPFAHPRTPQMFQRITSYDFLHWRQRKRNATRAVVECTVQGGIQGVERFLLRTEIVGAAR